jgi:glycerol-3-phosphate dehydrogenase
MEDIGLAGTGPRLAAIAHLIDRNDGQMRHWRPDSSGRRDQEAPAFPESVRMVDVYDLADTPLVFLWTPIHRMRETLRELGDVLSGDQLIVHLSRTLEYATLTSVSSMVEEETPVPRCGFVTGPMVPDDVVAGRGASAVGASEFPEVNDYVEDVLQGPGFRFFRSTDLAGTQAAAVYARILSLVAGIADELDVGQSLRSTLFATGLAEMREFVVYQGGVEQTAFGLAGAGNLHVDTSGDGGIDFRIGRELADGGLKDIDAYRDDLGAVDDEIFGLIDSLASQARRGNLKLKLLDVVDRVVFAETTLDEAVEELVGR